MPPVPEDQTAQVPADVDLRGELGAAFDAFEATDAGTDNLPVVSAQPGERPAPAPAQDQTGAQPRGPDGKFAPKGAEETKPEPTTPQAAAEPGAQPAQTIAPPPSWSAPAKAMFATLDPTIQAEVLKREGEIAQGKLEWEGKAERFNRLDSILAPRRERFALAGIDEAQALNALFAAQDLLETRPVDALLYLGRQSGVNWQTLFQRLQGAPQPNAVPPGLEPIARQVQTLTQNFEQSQQAARQAALAGHMTEIQTFATDPKNLYFENVRGRMGQLIRDRQASSLQDAYDQACWSDPQVRPLMMQAAEQQRQSEARSKEAQRVAQARQASGSVIGSPTPGASGGPASKGTVRDDLSAVWDALA